MLQLRNITKEYITGNQKVLALDEVSISFGSAEFVAVLGPSGCGKTTLLNVIGGLDRYDRGDLLISGRSTKDYSDREMDAYRNHSVGFVFQTYNLIPHQSVLSNVELSLTLSGVSAAERKQRAGEALESVGLKDQMTKRPNQLSGGQMQRVAIARALVNDPDILLADEPTGALDSHTSMQLMDSLKALARDRLVIMVTHNRELAQKYATRIVELRDGKVVSDSAPFLAEQEEKISERGHKTSMGFKTALLLSLSNLMTKRGRTLITALAGSIGIIGIALILSMSNGVNTYIDNIQRDTMSSYPIVIQEEAVEIGGMMSTMQETRRQQTEHELDAVYVDDQATRRMSGFRSGVSRNNLTAFKAYLEEEGNPLRPFLSDVRYGYDARFDVYTYDPQGELVNISGGAGSSMSEAFASFIPFSFSTMSELTPASDDGLIGEAVKSSHTILAGRWPQSAGETVLILDSQNEVSDMVLYQLGILPRQELRSLMQGEAVSIESARRWSYEELLGREFILLTYSDYYLPDGQGLFADRRDDRASLNGMLENAPRLTISGIVRSNDGIILSSGGLGYTRALTDLVIQRTQNSPVVITQLQNPQSSAISGLAFSPSDEGEKARNVRKYLDGLNDKQKAEFVEKALRFFTGSMLQEDQFQNTDENRSFSLPQGMSPGSLLALLQAFYGFNKEAQPGEDTGDNSASVAAMMEGLGGLSGFSQEALAKLDDAQLAEMLDQFVLAADDVILTMLYDGLIAQDTGTLDETLDELGVVDLNTPSSISLYSESFENKEKVAQLIRDYNQTVAEEDRIVYTDYVALMISSVTTIINVISYVLIAFVAVSLVVSSIMIGIITYISVLERTKEIGILRALGASKKDVGRVFTAEAFIIGLAAGILGVLISALLIIPINSIIHRLANETGINAILPLGGAMMLVAISALLSLLAGFMPARFAAKKDPVEALRTE